MKDVKPCEMECPMCGALDVVRLFRGKGTNRETEKYDKTVSRFECVKGFVATAYRNHIMHHCRVCQHDWQTPTMTLKKKEVQ